MLKKLLSLCIASAMMLSGMTAFAQIEIPLKNGAVMVVYEEGDEIPEIPQTRSSTFTFSSSFPAYPSYNYIHDSSGNETITVPIGYNTLRFNFTRDLPTLYLNVFSMYEGDYITSGTNGLMLVPSPADVFDIKDLNVGNYKVGFAGRGTSISISGTVTPWNS